MANNLQKFINQMEIIKYLQIGDTRANTCLKFDIDDRTFRNYFNKEKTVDLGKVRFPTTLNRSDGSWNITIDARTNPKDEVYKSSVHPIFLPLNMTEVYMLTHGILDMLDENSPYYAIYKHIGDKIYSQLSDYAKQRLQDNRHSFCDLDHVDYEPEIEMLSKIKEYGVGFYQKMAYRVKIEYLDGTFIEGMIKSDSDCMDPYIVDDQGEKHVIHCGDLIKNIERI